MPNNNAEKFIKEHLRIEHYMEAYTQDGFDRLKTYLGRVWKGQPKIYTAPFAKGQSMQRVLRDWMKTLVSIQESWPSLFAFEEDLAKKVGPMSVQKPLSERFGDIEHYWTDILLPSKPIADEAIQSVIREMRSVGALRLRSEQDTVNLMKKSTNSGNPYHTKRRNVVQDTLPCSTITDDDGSVWGTVNSRNHAKSMDIDLVAEVGWRGQEGGPSEEDVKQRVVWMFPFSLNINELQVYQPLIEQCQKFNLVPAWVSMESVDKRITDLFDTKASDDLVVCTDFSKFDQHFNPTMQNCAEAILNALLAKGGPSQHWLRDVFRAKYNIPLCFKATDTDHIHLIDGPHGMASGSGGTNADETLTHRALQYEAALLNGAKLNPNSQCLGDDGILSYPGITVEDVVEAYQSHGQECNLDKQYASSQDCVYLRRWHHKDYRENGVCVGVYSTCRALGRLRFLERWMDPEYWSPELVALRQLSIIENCKYHPLKEEFVKFCMKRDKFRLGLDLPGFLDNITQLAVEATDHMQDFLGYTKTLQGEGPEGIANWWVVNYLKSLG